MRSSTIDWREQDTESEFERLYHIERDPELQPRLQALWLLRRGRSRAEVADVVGITGRALRNWIAWYRQGGIEMVKSHHQGGYGHLPRLSDEQYEEIRKRAGDGQFRVIEDVRAFVEQEWSVHYTYWGMRSVLDKLHIHRRMPRPVASKADPEVQEHWKKGGWLTLSRHRG